MMKSWNIILFFALLFTITSCTTNSPEIVFTDVNVVPMKSEVILPNQTVVIKEGRIAEIGPYATTKISNKALQIDGTGKYLMPGLADMHTHVWSENDLILFLANGVTTIRNMGGAPIHLEFRKKIQKGELLGPDIYTAGPVIDGFPPIWPGSVEVEGPYNARKVITEQKEAGYDFIKIYNNLSKSGFEAIMSIAKEYDIPVAGHVPFNITLQKALESGMACIEHFEGYGIALQADDSPFINNTSFSMTGAWEYLDDEKLTNIVLKTKASGVWNCPTMVVFQKMFINADDVEKMLNKLEMQYVAPVIKNKWRERDYNEDIAAKADQIYKARRKLLRLLHEQNANILSGTDSGNPFTVHGFSMHEELRYFIDAGFLPYEAIKTGTVDAAKFLNATEEFGTVEVGRIANLLLLENNPLDDIANLSKIAGVMIRGKWLSARELRLMLQEIATQYDPGINLYLQ